MPMGRKRKRPQDTMWVATSDLPKSPGHPFYQRLNQVLAANSFDAFVEAACRRFYAPTLGRPSLPPGRYFRVMLLGYFEGLGSERAMAWRAADSLAIRSFLGLELDEAGPDHSTISRTRRLIDVETHQRVFAWVLERLAKGGLLVGKTIGIDATTLEANAAMRSIVRRDTGASYEEFLKGLARASGIKTPTREALARLDRRRKKKASNDDWTSPSDPDAKITKMKDGRTHLAHKAEHAVDVRFQGGDRGFESLQGRHAKTFEAVSGRRHRPRLRAEGACGGRTGRGSRRGGRGGGPRRRRPPNRGGRGCRRPGRGPSRAVSRARRPPRSAAWAASLRSGRGGSPCDARSPGAPRSSCRPPGPVADRGARRRP